MASLNVQWLTYRRTLPHFRVLFGLCWIKSLVKTIQFELIHHLVSYHLISVGGATDAGGDANKNGDAKVSNRTSQFEKAPRPKHRAGLTSHESRNQEIKYQKMDSEFRQLRGINIARNRVWNLSSVKHAWASGILFLSKPEGPVRCKRRLVTDRQNPIVGVGKTF